MPLQMTPSVPTWQAAQTPAVSSLPRPTRALAALGLLLLTIAAAATAQTLHVGPGRDIPTLAEAARRARAGDTIEVDAADYVADVAVWTQPDLTLRALGGRVRVLANGASAEGKGTWVVRVAGRFSVEGFDFIGSRVPNGNGAGIRFERGALSVRDCRFLDNENGILTGNDAALELDIEGSEFGHNGQGDGRSHNLYAGTIARLSVVGSYFHHAQAGHLLKSRAARNDVSYNRLTDESGGSASYELEFPVGGIARVVGNLIEQGPQTENPVMVSFGIEGYRHAANRLELVRNTLVDRRAQAGVFVRVAPGADAVRLVDNLLAGPGDLSAAGPGDFAGNVTVALADFDAAVADDYRWQRRPAWLRDAVDGASLAAVSEYRHPRQVVPVNPRRLVVGAVQPQAGGR